MSSTDEIKHTFGYVQLSLRSGDLYYVYINTVALVKVARRVHAPSEGEGHKWKEHFEQAQGLRGGEQR
jgi:hypothetical protein